MKKRRTICVALLGLAGAVAGVVLMLYDYARADVLGGPLPAPRLPRDIIQLTPVEKLGKLMLYDSTLSNPPGYSCAACHVPETGFTGPNSEINAFAGPQPGIVPAAIARCAALGIDSILVQGAQSSPKELNISHLLKDRMFASL